MPFAYDTEIICLTWTGGQKLFTVFRDSLSRKLISDHGMSSYRNFMVNNVTE